MVYILVYDLAVYDDFHDSTIKSLIKYVSFLQSLLPIPIKVTPIHIYTVFLSVLFSRGSCLWTRNNTLFTVANRTISAIITDFPARTPLQCKVLYNLLHTLLLLCWLNLFDNANSSINKLQLLNLASFSSSKRFLHKLIGRKQQYKSTLFVTVWVFQLIDAIINLQSYSEYFRISGIARLKICPFFRPLIHLFPKLWDTIRSQCSAL